MDDDDLRRGKPTVHKAFDEWTAILAGDALLTLAFELLASPTHTPIRPSARSWSLRLAQAAGAAGMVGGQCLDLEADKLGAPRPDRAHVQRLQAMKTGALIRFACEAGAMLGRADAGAAPRAEPSATLGPPSRLPTTCWMWRGKWRRWVRPPARTKARPRWSRAWACRRQGRACQAGVGRNLSAAAIRRASRYPARSCRFRRAAPS